LSDERFPRSEAIFELAEKTGTTREAADKLMHDYGIIRAAEILAEKIASI
jgi:hypothetical protein